MACPLCAKDTDAAYRPFCSKRCADLDLAKWMDGSYAVASQNEDDHDALIDELEKAAEKAAEDGEDAPKRPRPS